MNPIIIEFEKLHKDAEIPERKSQGAGAYDIRACLDEPVTLLPGERAAVPTGLRVQVPEEYILSVRPRSGLALHDGVTLINSPGTIDSDYRGEVKVLIVNLGQQKVEITHSERIAQVILERAFPVDWVETTRGLSKTERGEGGFGSTGRK